MVAQHVRDHVPPGANVRVEITDENEDSSHGRYTDDLKRGIEKGLKADEL